MNRIPQYSQSCEADFKQQWQIDALFVADAALYTQENLQQMQDLRWVSRVPATLASARLLLEKMSEDAFEDSALSGYRIGSCCSDYAEVQQRWIVVESQARQQADLKQLDKRLPKQLSFFTIRTAAVVSTTFCL